MKESTLEKIQKDRQYLCNSVCFPKYLNIYFNSLFLKLLHCLKIKYNSKVSMNLMIFYYYLEQALNLKINLKLSCNFYYILFFAKDLAFFCKLLNFQIAYYAVKIYWFQKYQIYYLQTHYKEMKNFLYHDIKLKLVLY